MVIIGVSSLIGSLASLVLFMIVAYGLYSFGTAAYATMVVNFHEPAGEDYTTAYYKQAAAAEAGEYLKQIQKDSWEKHGLVVLTQEDRNWVWASVRWQLMDGKYWSGYEGKKVAHVMDPYIPKDDRSDNSIQKTVYYAGDGVYRVKTSLRVNFDAVGVDGKLWKEYAQVNYNYVTTLKCNPKRKFWGRVRMNWEVVDVEYEGANMSNEEVLALTESTPCPKDKKTAAKEAERRKYVEKMKEQTVF